MRSALYYTKVTMHAQWNNDGEVINALSLHGRFLVLYKEVLVHAILKSVTKWQSVVLTAVHDPPKCVK